MAVPDYQSLMAPVLQALADGDEHPMSQLRAVLPGQLGLTEDDLRATIRSGTPLFANWLHWAVTYLYHAGLLRRPRRAVVQITDRGQEVLGKHPGRVDLGVTAQFPEFIDFRRRSRRASQGSAGEVGISEATPGETIAVAVEEASVVKRLVVNKMPRSRESQPL